MNKIKINSYSCENDTIKTGIAVSGDAEFMSMFREAESELKLRYSIKLKDIPYSLGVIPALSVLLPVAWIFDAEIECDELDKAFYDGIDGIKTGYIDMYPTMQFKGKVSPGKIVENKTEGEKCLVLFSGGVDAFNTLASHYSEKPEFLTIWGVDIAPENETGWSVVKKQVEDISGIFSLEYNFVHTNCRRILDEKKLNSYIVAFDSLYNWWHDFQHGICIISHSVPLAYSKGMNTVYIASSYTADDKGTYTCASDPTIDNKFRFSSSIVVHDGFEFNRQQKIENICKFREKTGKDIPLRVCYESKTGDNCCRCVKCYRTILEILAEGADPAALGFDLFNDKRRKKMMKDLKIFRIPTYRRLYQITQKRLREVYTHENCPKDLLWFYDMDIVVNKKTKAKKFFRYKRKFMRGCTKLFGIRW